MFDWKLELFFSLSLSLLLALKTTTRKRGVVTKENSGESYFSNFNVREKEEIKLVSDLL